MLTKWGQIDSRLTFVRVEYIEEGRNRFVTLLKGLEMMFYLLGGACISRSDEDDEAVLVNVMEVCVRSSSCYDDKEDKKNKNSNFSNLVDSN